MGVINLDHTGSGGGVTLSSDGSSLLLGGSAVGGGASIEVVHHTTLTSDASSVDITGINNNYVQHMLVCAWARTSASQQLPEAIIYKDDGSGNYSTMAFPRFDEVRSSSYSQSSLGYVPLSGYVNGTKEHVSVMNFFGFGETNKIFMVMGHGWLGYPTDDAKLSMFGGSCAAESGKTPSKININTTWGSIPSGAKITLYGLKSS